MSNIAGEISVADTPVLVTVNEVPGKRIRIHSVSGGFLPAPAAGAERNLGLTYDTTTVGRWPVYKSAIIDFPVELHAPLGDGAGAGDVHVQLNGGGTGVVGYVSITYTVVP